MSLPLEEECRGGGGGGVAVAASLLAVMEASACSALHDETDELQWIADYSYEGSVNARSWASLGHQGWPNKNAPLQRSILNMDLSYEDFSKNMDANLAQIDMETFRSEDINTAILSLQRAAGEEGASLSGSLIDDLPIDSSQRVNDICRKTPLFSPLKEASVPTASHISMADSLDCSYHGDLVLTCRATNKNNYTLAFEQSQVMATEGMSDESNSELGGSSEATNWSSDNANNRSDKGMIHSEFAYTTWSRVSDGKEGDSSALKSHSLPDLLRRSMMAQLHKNSLQAHNTLYTINDCQVVEDKRSGVPLLRMFMDKGRSNPALGVGSPDAMHCSASSLSDGVSRNITTNTSPDGPEMTDSITMPITTMPIFNAKGSLDTMQQPANAVPNVHQVRARQNLDNTLNNNVVLEESTALSEEDSSQCFEDSLVGMLAAGGGVGVGLGVKRAITLATLASPIREEEELMASSCDEPMRDVNSSNSSEDSRNQSPPYDQTKPPVTPKINNFVGRGSSAARKELAASEQSVSSGYISRQNSNDQINKSPNAQHFLLSSGNRRATAVKQTGSGSSSGSLLQCSTQVRTVAIQTGSSTSSSSNSSSQAERSDQCHVVTPEQLTDPARTPIRKSIYVCYPNYSLPDLSFLKDIKPGHAVVLQPTEIGTTKIPAPVMTKESQQHTNVAAAMGTPSRRRAQSSDSKCRPKSYNDYEALLRNGVEKIKDWESLSLLLPDDVKLMVKQIRGDLPVRMRDKAGRQPRPLRIDQICGDYTAGCEEVYISGGTGLHMEERDSSARRHSLLNLPSLTGLIPTGLDLNTVAAQQANFSSRDSSGSCCCRTKKAVSFSDNLCKGIGEHRTPSTCGCRNFALNLQLQEQGCLTPGSVGSRGGPLRELTPQGLSPSGFISPLTHSQHEIVTGKRLLLDSIYNAIRQVVDAYGKDKEKDTKMQVLNDDSVSGKEVHKTLLPAVEALMADGLLAHVRGLFGPLPNSKWHLVESMVQTKEGRKEVRELLDYIHSVNANLEENAKFACFILGLINLGCLDTWITLLLATSSVQHKHYSSTAFLPLLSHYSFFFLQEELVSNLRILSELPFAFNLNLSAKMRPSAGIKERSVSASRVHSRTPVFSTPATSPTAPKAPTSEPRMRRSKTDVAPQGRTRPVSYPAAVKKEPEPPKKDTHKFRQLRTQWEKMSGALPNRPAVATSGNMRVNQADNLRRTKTTTSTSTCSRPLSSPHRAGSQTASPVKSSRSQTGGGDSQNVVLVRRSLIPIRGWSAKQQSAARK